jgi:hypothetical protein
MDSMFKVSVITLNAAAFRRFPERVFGLAPNGMMSPPHVAGQVERRRARLI